MSRQTWLEAAPEPIRKWVAVLHIIGSRVEALDEPFLGSLFVHAETGAAPIRGFPQRWMLAGFAARKGTAHGLRVMDKRTRTIWSITFLDDGPSVIPIRLFEEISKTEQISADIRAVAPSLKHKLEQLLAGND